MINVVIPMAGLGSRFAKVGYKKPKPFIDVNGLPMIERVLKNLQIPGAKYFLIANHEHVVREKALVNSIMRNYNVEFITVDKLTEGTACTILFANKKINNDKPLLVANSDQIVDLDINLFIKDAQNRNLDGSILCFEEKNKSNKWSYAKINEKGLVTEVREKKAISSIATVGIYFFNKGKLFVDGAIEMIVRNDRVNNEFYTCPVYNYLVKDDKDIGVYLIESKDMNGIGTPEDLKLYLKNKF